MTIFHTFVRNFKIFQSPCRAWLATPRYFKNCNKMPPKWATDLKFSHSAHPHILRVVLKFQGHKSHTCRVMGLQMTWFVITKCHHFLLQACGCNNSIILWAFDLKLYHRQDHGMWMRSANFQKFKIFTRGVASHALFFKNSNKMIQIWAIDLKF